MGSIFMFEILWAKPWKKCRRLDGVDFFFLCVLTTLVAVLADLGPFEGVFLDMPAMLCF
jgi:hypothetical protein